MTTRIAISPRLFAGVSTDNPALFVQQRSSCIHLPFYIEHQIKIAPGPVLFVQP